MRLTIVDRRGLIATLVALGVMVLSFVAAFTWLQYRMMDVHSRQILQSMRQELLLRQQYERSVGRQALVAGIDLRNRVVSDGRYFALFTSDRQPVVGSLSAIPGGERVFESRFAPYTVDSDNGIKYYVASMRNEDGSIFVMVQGDKDQREIALSLGRAAAVNTFMVILIGVIAAYVLNRYMLDHVRGLAMTAQQIMRGQMAARAPARRRLDAMGALTTTFNDMLDQNESLVTGMRTVTESLAHDLRSPLMRVSRSIAAARQTDSDVVREQLLNDAETDATRALQTFNSLIDLARAEAGLSRDSMEKLDLGSLATDVAELFEPLAEERGQRLERHISPIGIFGHPQILKQALGNLLENAIKYSPAGSTLRLAVKPSPESGAAEIVVEDSGPGIPENAHEQAVRPFVRLESPVRQPGAGLGLAIAAAVARLHRGKLILENADPGLRVRLQFGHQ
jgi:signal transduction histidine kinase